MAGPQITFQEIARFFEEEIPFNKHLGLRLPLAHDGKARVEAPFRPEFIGDPFRPAIHGGVLSTLIDTVGGAAVWSRLELMDRVSTIDLRVDYLAPGRSANLVAEATVVRLGNRVGVADVRVFHEDDPATTIATGKAVYNVKRLDAPVPAGAGRTDA